MCLRPIQVVVSGNQYLGVRLLLHDHPTKERSTVFPWLCSRLSTRTRRGECLIWIADGLVSGDVGARSIEERRAELCK